MPNVIDFLVAYCAGPSVVFTTHNIYRLARRNHDLPVDIGMARSTVCTGNIDITILAVIPDRAAIII